MYKVIALKFNIADVANKESSEAAFSFCKCAEMQYHNDGTVSVFAIVDEKLNVSEILSQLPIIKDAVFDENDLKNAQFNCDMLNGIIKPVELK